PLSPLSSMCGGPPATVPPPCNQTDSLSLSFLCPHTHTHTHTLFLSNAYKHTHTYTHFCLHVFYPVFVPSHPLLLLSSTLSLSLSQWSQCSGTVPAMPAPSWQQGHVSGMRTCWSD